MKKFLCLLMCCLTVSAAGCSDKSKTANGKAADELNLSDDNSSQYSSEEETSSKRSKDIDVNTNYKHIYDDAGVFNDAQSDDINSYCAWLSKTFKISAAVASTDDLDGSDPSDYAQNIYESNYSGDGILFLINNDTENDYFYRTGVPEKFISNSDIQMLFSEISPMLALEDFSSAAELALEEAEKLLPEYFTDRTGTLEKQEISSYNDMIKEKSDGKNLNIYYVIGTGDQNIDDFAAERFKWFYDSDKDTAMLVINGENGENSLCLSGSMNYLSENQSEIKKAIKSCYNKKDGMNLDKAVEQFLSFIE